MKKIFPLFMMLCLAKNSKAQNVGISTPTPTHAKLEINGSVGAAVAMFGADKYGVTIEADNPEVGFNYFYNNGQKTIKAGYGSVIGMNPVTGELYFGNFNGNQSASNFGAINGYRQNLTLFQSGEFRLAGSTQFSHFYYGANEDTYIRGGKTGSYVLLNDIPGGNVGIGTSSPVHANLEVGSYVGGVFGGSNALFGDGNLGGTSLNNGFYQGVGLNYYYDGTVAAHRTISPGYAGLLGFDISNGDMYLANFNGTQSAGAFGSISGLSKRLTIQQNGNIVVTGKISTPATGPANLLPIVFGKINSDGTVLSGTGNFSVSKTATGNYEITLTNENSIYTNQNLYSVLVTPFYNTAAGGGELGDVSFVTEINQANKLAVHFSKYVTSWVNHGDCGCPQTELNTYINTAGYASRDVSFSFMVYKLQ